MNDVVDVKFKEKMKAIQKELQTLSEQHQVTLIGVVIDDVNKATGSFLNPPHEIIKADPREVISEMLQAAKILVTGAQQVVSGKFDVVTY